VEEKAVLTKRDKLRTIYKMNRELNDGMEKEMMQGSACMQSMENRGCEEGN